jgi:hypothetical protein
MPEPLTTISGVALKKLLEGLVSAASEPIKRKLKYIHNEATQKKIYKAIASVGKVKTMWSMDKEVKLLPIYYPSKIVVDKTAKTVSRVHEIDPLTSFVIRGTVGQGKSIFLRYLCLQELKHAERVPIFAELRRFDRTKSFRHFLEERLTVMGFETNGETFEYFAKSGKLLLLLDGFDELEPSAVMGVISELESLIEKYPDLQVVVTSRPDGGIEKSAFFRVYQLAELTPYDHEPFLKTVMSGDKKRVTEILTVIRKSSAQIRTLLTTPLLLTLLVIVYNATQEIPPSLSAFYDELFRTLAVKHDNNKPGFRRPRATKLSDWDLRRLFEAYCYGARQKNLLLLSESAHEKILTQASKHTGFLASPDDFAKDITKVTCLMQKEGFHYQFIHKSVVEFHAASFIQRSADEAAQKFYYALQEIKWFTWRQELLFLSELDRYRYLKYFLVPSMRRGLLQFGVDPDNDSETVEIKRELWIERLDNFTVMRQNLADPNAPVQMQWGTSAISNGGEKFEQALVSGALRLLQVQLQMSPRMADPPGARLGVLALQYGFAEEILAHVRAELKEWVMRYKATVVEIRRDEGVADFINP